MNEPNPFAFLFVLICYNVVIYTYWKQRSVYKTLREQVDIVKTEGLLDASLNPLALLEVIRRTNWILVELIALPVACLIIGTSYLIYFEPTDVAEVDWLVYALFVGMVAKYLYLIRLSISVIYQFRRLET